MENKEIYSVKGKNAKGFGTFVLTLSISLIVFSALYYFLTSSSADTSQFDVSLDKEITKNDVTSDFNVQKEESEEKDSVFGEIASVDPKTLPRREVLAGSTTAVQETTQSTSSLNTGVVSITIGLFTALTIFISALIFVYKNPRNLALSTFEKKTSKGL